jgi:hypothetical protein
LSWKNSCSPAVKTKSAPQSIHFRTLSWNSMESCSLQPAIPAKDMLSCLLPEDRTESPAGSRTFFGSGQSPKFGPTVRRARHYRYYCGTAKILISPAQLNKTEGRRFARRPCVRISPALYEPSSGCACAPVLPSHGAFRPA